ncbi:MAG: hypothetical protein A2275_02645 [Bacteroidetes bacterium RIFOXYA12_FULL_35_11]|nr:MAG: hypothetical protein A2X01_07055 [Bacteroidetes bacterium GWF2_35_48]OFY82100.1 MAG: hypothetical protein A2275_02645 [Bacteroidetes bacterium RIFOXYA12_FULL_35_11]OFY93298.1 MAG: hypothetical protein A2491_15450 [Bacteroidetes bacterium RIFOXYC12_FULL_35_7]HBX53144.1 hypothetical protein [Bacteroidales bacterium]
MKKNNSIEENEILDAFNSDSLKRSENFQSDLLTAKQTAINTFDRTIQIRIKLTEKEISKLKAKAIEAGLSYQSLITALIHNYTNNKIQLSL